MNRSASLMGIWNGASRPVTLAGLGLTFMSCNVRANASVYTFGRQETTASVHEQQDALGVEAVSADPWEAVTSRMFGFTDLARGWDSYSGVAVPVATAIRGLFLISELKSIIGFMVEAVPMPFVTHWSDGSLQFEWQVGRKALEIVIPVDSSQKLQYLTALETERDESVQEGEINEPTVKHLHRLLRWLMAEK